MAFSLMDAVIKVALEDKASSKLKSVTSGASKALAGFAIAGVTAAATATTAVVKSAVSAYANYEQLVGGIKKLYGEMDYNAVAENAANAFKTVGMSANDYMNSITAFSASLINSLGGNTEEAAAVADLAMRDIADNANTFGKYSVQELTGVYQALARGNFQTLDNLNLGYAGTKDGMEQLIKKANELRKANGEAGDLTIDSYADMIQAIHEVQNSLNITGTTANEAASTIEGSANQMKAAWQNMLTGLADPTQNFDQLLNDLLESVQAYASNIVPRMQEALNGFGKMVQKLAPQVIAKVPELVKAGMQMVSRFALSIMENAPQMIDSAFELISVLANELLNNLPTLMQTAGELVGMLIVALVEHFPEVIEAGGKILAALVGGIMAAIAGLWETAGPMVMGWIGAIIAWATDIYNRGSEFINNFINGVKEYIGDLIATGVEAVNNFIEGINQKINDIIAKATEILTEFGDAIKAGFDTMVSAGYDLVRGIWQGISNGYGWITGKISGWVDDVLQFLKNKFGIASPSKKTAEMGYWLVRGLAKGIEDNTDIADKAWNTLASEISPLASEYDGQTATNSGGHGLTIVQNISATPQTPVELAAATESYFQMARWVMA